MNSLNYLVSKRHIALAACVSMLAVGAINTNSASAQMLDKQITGQFAFRSIGPAVFGGRITDVELIPGQPFTMYVAAASGGLYKTINNGTTWDCIFQNEGTISIGDIAVDHKNTDHIWVGTGEANNQRSSYWGDGVYKTTDGGKTWTNMGLTDSHHIGRIIIDPNNSNTVYVAALGHLYTSNDERGVFKTTDGGGTWTKSLFVDELTGAVDLVIDPTDSNVLYAATYERLRRAWHFDGAGPGSAIYKSTDAGGTWTKLEGGLPSGDVGRIGICISPQNPNLLYATVSNQNPQPVKSSGTANLGFKGELTKDGFKVTEVNDESSAKSEGLQVGDIILRIDGTDVNNLWALIKAISKQMPGGDVELVFKRGEEEKTIKIKVAQPAAERDAHGISTRQIGGEIYRSEDAGATWTKQNDRSVGGTPPYYYGQITIDPKDDLRLYVLSVPVVSSDDGGKTWSGNIAGSVHVDHHAFAISPDDSNKLVLGNDGGLAVSHDQGKTWDHYTNLPFSQFYAIGVDMQIPYHVYGGTQDNGTWGGPNTSRNRRGIANEEWYRVGGGDGFYAQIDPSNSNIVYGESQFGGVYRLDKNGWQSRSIRPPRGGNEGPRSRYNWSSPILISHHNPQIVYFGGNKLFKSLNRGDTWPIVSPDLTTADEEKIKGNVPHCTITSIAESPINPNLLLIGTDDGMVQLSADGGVTWTNLAGRFTGAPTNWWVSRVELSRHDVNVAYVTFTGYREDDFRPFVYMTSNGGKNWESISSNLPDEPINVIKEDTRNPNLLYVGTEMGVYASIDKGANWFELGNGLPTIPVHDLIVHPRDNDLVLATHGRGFYVADISALQEISTETLAKAAHLFNVENTYQLRSISTGSSSGNRTYYGKNAATGAAISYYLAADIEEDNISLRIEDVTGKTVRNLEPKTGKGLHSMIWNFRADSRRGQQGQISRGQGRRRGGFTPQLPTGTYTAVLKVGETEERQTFKVLPDPIIE